VLQWRGSKYCIWGSMKSFLRSCNEFVIRASALVAMDSFSLESSATL
jgi:hypothetical protein